MRASHGLAYMASHFRLLNSLAVRLRAEFRMSISQQGLGDFDTRHMSTQNTVLLTRLTHMSTENTVSDFLSDVHFLDLGWGARIVT